MVRLRRDIPFAVHDGVTLFGDLYSPEQGGPYPVLIAVPGGGWLRGDRTQLEHWGRRLAEAGFAVFVVDYRRSIHGKVFPENAQDVLAATKFVHGEADELGVDRRRMGLLGASAGAHLAALTALGCAEPLFAGVYPDDKDAAARPLFRVLVGVYGVYDLAAHWRSCQAADASPKDDLADRMMGAGFQEDEAAYRRASPISYIASIDPALAVMLIWGASDTTVAPAQSEVFAAALRGEGVTVATLPVTGAGHFWFSKETDTASGFNGAVAPALLRFLNERLAAAR